MTQENPSTNGTSGNRSRLRKRYFFLTLGPLLVATVGGYLFFTGGRYVETENAYVKANKVAISAQVSGPIAAVEVQENQVKEKNAILFRIDEAPFRVALNQAKARLQSIRQEIESLKASYRQKAEELKLARTVTSHLERDFKRQFALARKKIVSAVKLDEIGDKLAIARQQHRVIDQEMAEVRARLGGDPDIPVERQSSYRVAKGAVDRAALNLEHTAIRAPFTGIASKTPELGQYVNAGVGVMSVVANKGMWIEANYKETDLTHVRPGMPVTIHVDTYSDLRWRGEVESISQATGSEFSIIPAQNATGNWIKVVQRIPVRIAVQTRGSDPVLRAGMSTIVSIDTGHKRPAPALIQPALSWLQRTFSSPLSSWAAEVEPNK